jgi:hypothetical protein
MWELQFSLFETVGVHKQPVVSCNLVAGIGKRKDGKLYIEE